MKKIATTTVLVIALGAAVAACSTGERQRRTICCHEDGGRRDYGSSDADSGRPGPGVHPRDEGQARLRQASGRRGADQMKAWLNADSLDDGSVASHDLSETYRLVGPVRGR